MKSTHHAANRMLSLLNQILSGPYSLALVSSQGDLVHGRFQNFEDSATLPFAATTCQKYLNMGVGDVALINDPYSGGTCPHSISLATPVKGWGKETLILSARLPLAPRLYAKKPDKVDNEGLRIPPMPLLVSGKLQTTLVEHLTSSPMAPRELGGRLQDLLLFLSRKATFLNTWLARPQSIPGLSVTNYIDFARESLKRRIADLPHKEVILEVPVLDRKNLQIRLNPVETHIEVELRTADKSLQEGLTDLMTLSLVVSTIHDFLQDPLPLTSAYFSSVQLQTPAKSWLNVKYPAPVGWGLRSGQASLMHGLIQALNTLDPARARGGNASPGWIEFQTANGQLFSHRLAGGMGGSAKSIGASAQMLNWGNHFPLEIPQTWETFERELPLQISRIGYREKSGGKGVHSGGEGLVCAISSQDLAPVEVRWHFHGAQLRAPGAQGGGGGAPAEIFLLAKGKKKEELPVQGSTTLQTGDTMVFLSGGGGGWGSPETATEEAADNT